MIFWLTYALYTGSILLTKSRAIPGKLECIIRILDAKCLF